MGKQVHLHEFQFRFQITRGQVAVLLSAALLVLMIEPIATEQITLSTYYPAPAGVYNNLLSIGNTWLARDNVPSTGVPSFVELGDNKAVLKGTKLAVMNGLVGIGTLSPGALLDVNGTARTQGFVMPPGAINGYVLTSDKFGAATWQPPAAAAKTVEVYKCPSIISGGCGSSCIGQLSISSYCIYQTLFSHSCGNVNSPCSPAGYLIPYP